MPDAALASAIKVDVDGQPLAADVEPALVRVVVDDHLLLPDTFELTLQETPDATICDKARLRVGAVVKISTSALGEATPSLLIHGEVTALEGVYREGKAPLLVARGYDHSHRLSRGRKSATFANAKYSDVARDIASKVGLQVGRIDDSGSVHDHLGQAGQTDWDFLRNLAREVGFEVAVAEGKLDFRRPAEAANAPDAGDLDAQNPLQLVFGQDLLEFRPRITSSGQVSRVEVRGWDTVAKQAIIATAQAGTTAAQLPDGPGSLAERFGSPVLTMESAHQDQGSADRAAAALAEKVGSAFAEASGIARGNPKLKAGAAVNVSQVAAPFAGRYTLSHTRHSYDPRDGYRTHFIVSGRQDRSLMGLIAGASGGNGASAGGGGRGGGGGGGGGGSAAKGVAVAIVTDIDDPQMAGRVKLKFPWLAADYVSDWARVAAPGNGVDRGMVWTPEVNDEVLVAFEGGDSQHPFVLGGLWNGADKPPTITVKDGQLERRAFVSRDGNEIYMADKQGDSSLGMKSKGDEVVLHLSGTDQKIEGTSKGKIVLTATGDIEIKATGKVKLSGAGGVEISSDAQAKLSGSAGVEVSTSGVAKVSGSQVQLG
jgi:phage protein D/phage baseplate assembly protein gpV